MPDPPKTASRAVKKEYLATLDDAAFGAAGEVMPKFISPVRSGRPMDGGDAGPGVLCLCQYNCLIDVKFAVIVDVRASRAIRRAEVGAAKTMIDRTEDRFGLKPARLAADTAWIGRRPRLDRQRQRRLPRTFPSLTSPGTTTARGAEKTSRSAAGHPTSISARKASCCTRTGRIHDGRTLLYRARTVYPIVALARSRHGAARRHPRRKIPRSIYEDARDVCPCAGRH